MNREGLLRIFLESEPTARSPYQLYGCPPMWPVLTEGEGETARELFGRPCRTMERHNFSYVEVDGVSWQWRQGETWIPQGMQGGFESFLEREVAPALARGATLAFPEPDALPSETPSP